MPTTCAEQHACGLISDGCSKVLDCGACSGTDMAATSGTDMAATGGTDMASIPPEYQSGSRLRLKTVKTADGANGVYGLYDSQLLTDCYSSQASDKSLRCVPSAMGTSNRYSDSNCQSLLGVAVCPMSPSPKFATEYATQGCGGPQYHSLVGVYSGPLFYSSGGQCSPDPSPPSWTYYTIAQQETPPSAFVAAAPVQGTRYGRLAKLSTTFADGATQPAGWHDTQLDVDCWFNPSGDGTERCLPTLWYGFTGDLFADSSCSTTLASTTSCYSSLIRYAVPVGDYLRPNSISQVIGPHAGPVWQKSGTQCTPYSGQEVALDVKPASLSAFVSGTLSVDPQASGARIQRQLITNADGVRQSRAWYDTQLGVECWFAVAGDGKMRCMPGTANAYGFFADMNCKQPLAQLSDPTTKYALQSGSNCAPPTYYTLGSQYGGTVYVASGTTCAKVASPPAGLYTVGAAVPVTTFVEGTLTTQ
jgi:hypothetical protein